MTLEQFAYDVNLYTACRATVSDGTMTVTHGDEVIGRVSDEDEADELLTAARRATDDEILENWASI
jgi:hypothetical protein